MSGRGCSCRHSRQLKRWALRAGAGWAHRSEEQRADAAAYWRHPQQPGAGKGETPQGNRRAAGGGWRRAKSGRRGHRSCWTTSHSVSGQRGYGAGTDGDASKPDLPTCSSSDLTPPASHQEKRSPSSELPIFSVLNTHTHRQADSFVHAEPSGPLTAADSRPR